MVTINPSGVISKCSAYLGVNTHHDASFCKITHVNTLSTAFSPRIVCGPCSNVANDSTISWKGCSQLRTHHVLQRVASNRWLVSISEASGLKISFDLSLIGRSVMVTLHATVPIT